MFYLFFSFWRLLNILLSTFNLWLECWDHRSRKNMWVVNLNILIFKISYINQAHKVFITIFFLKNGWKFSAATHARWIFCALSCFGLGSIYSHRFRKGLRTLYNLPEEPCKDFCVHFCCPLCAICQEYRELKNRGLDPSKGINYNFLFRNFRAKFNVNIVILFIW